jgi:hypothetical protein
MIAKGSLEVKLRTVWTDGKAEEGRAREEKESAKEKSDKRKEKRANR